MQKDGDAYRSSHLFPGLCRILVIAPGYESLRRGFRVQPGTETDLGDIELEHESWISGNIVDAEGNGVSAELRCDPYDPEKGPAPSMNSIYPEGTKGDGSFRIGRLSRGLYLVRPMNRGESAWAEWSKVIDTRSCPAEDVRIKLTRGVALIVHASDPQDWKSLRFKIIGAAGGTAKERRLWTFDPEKIMLAPGRYTVEVRTREGAEPKRIPVTITSQPLELAIP
jgi:hypothetical protein